MMNGLEKSDPAIVATKPANEAAAAAQEWVEPRAGTKGNTGQSRTQRTQGRERVSPGLDRVRQAARQRKKAARSQGQDHRRAIRRRHRAGFELESDAKRFQEAMRQRLERFGLELHEGKTRLVELGRFAAERRRRRGLGRPETFTFLGFTFICGKTRRGQFQLQRKSRGDRMRQTLREVKLQLRRRMHAPIPEQGQYLRAVVTGYYRYHAVPTNWRAINAFRDHVVDLWRRTLRRRSQKDGSTWQRVTRIANDWLPRPRILHPWPSERFAVKHPRWEPNA